jgi:hypothetical protein
LHRGCGASPFGTITLTQNGADTVHVTIALTNGAKFVKTGQDGSTIAFNLKNNPSITLSNSTLPGWSLDSSSAGSLQFDGFGDFEYSLNCCFSNNGGANAQAAPVDFDLTGTGLTPGSFAEKSTGGSPNVYFAVDILSATTGNTGPVGAVDDACTTCVQGTVPEPSAVSLLGIVVGLCGFMTYRRRRQA